VDLESKKGEIRCILGESGGGKTTLLNGIAGLTSFKGEMEYIPNDVADIFQENRLLPHLTIEQNLAFVGAKQEEIERALKGVELYEKREKRPSKLSGGERRRVSIARAFAMDFSLLLMDEPFSSLDTALKIRLIGVFANLWKEKKGEKTAIFVTHDLEEALMIADRIVVLSGGKIVFDEAVKREEFPSKYSSPSPVRQRVLEALDVK
jgi:ABC-type nitrate/sulfonate/bicarbonate transport system ATPase subunit